MPCTAVNGAIANLQVTGVSRPTITYWRSSRDPWTIAFLRLCNGD